MKKIWVVLLMAMILWPLPVLAADGGTGLPEAVMNGARRMVQAGVPEQDAMSMTRRMMENRFTEQEIVRAQEMVTGTVEEGLPAGPVLSKAMEGLAKRVEARAVLSAMENVRAQRAFARRTAAGLEADPVKAESLEEVTAEALAAGVREKDMDRLADRLRTRDRVQDPDLCQEAGGTVRDMARLGASSEKAVDAACAGLDQGFSAGDMRTMRNSFASRVRGASANDLAQGFARAAARGVGAGNLGRE
ncbi:MAG: hypothetical protein ABIJ95_05210, partial [Pseudomonadota bacterium]